MTLTLYKNYSDTKRLGKTLEAVGSVSAIWLDESSILTPVFVIKGAESYITANYLYCDRLARYYFIKDITLDSGGRKIFKCEVDPLETYAAYLRGQNFHIIRDSEKPTFTKDAKLPMKPYKKVDTIKFEESEFNLNTANEYSYNYVLVCAGGGSGESETK